MTVLLLLAFPLMALAQTGSERSSNEPFKVGTFEIDGVPRVGIVLRDSLIIDLYCQYRTPKEYCLSINSLAPRHDWSH